MSTNSQMHICPSNPVKWWTCGPYLSTLDLSADVRCRLGSRSSRQCLSHSNMHRAAIAANPSYHGASMGTTSATSLALPIPLVPQGCRQGILQWCVDGDNALGSSSCPLSEGAPPSIGALSALLDVAAPPFTACCGYCHAGKGDTVRPHQRNLPSQVASSSACDSAGLAGSVAAMVSAMSGILT